MAAGLAGAAGIAGFVLSGCAPGQEAHAVPRPKPVLSLAEAREYVRMLVNRDRAERRLGPTERDEVAERAAQRHVEDMTRSGFAAHWGTDGSVPEQRYTEAGGVHFVQENAVCFSDGKIRELDPDPTFEPATLERLQQAFMAEPPPSDGHRKNILKPVHNRLGIGIAKPVAPNQPCMSQEFVDAYGDYEELPKRADLGTTVLVSGTVSAPVEFGGIGIARIDLPHTLTAAELNDTASYSIPPTYLMFFPAGFETPKPVTLDGARFTIVLPLRERDREGRYEVSVWGKYPGSGDALAMISLRTILVTR